MKKIFRNSRLIAIAFFTLFTASATHAGDSSHTKPAIPAELRFAGMLNNDPLFILDVNGNAEHDDFIITINDRQGNSLYREAIKASIFSKKFLLNTEELGDETLLFEITSRKAKRSVVYEISRKGHYVDETGVRLLQ